MDINVKIKDMNSLKDLKEIAKYISKEEFLKKVINYNNACPNIINLEDCDNRGICSTTPCYSCWENAIKDIKFKGDVNMEFDWDGFKHNKIVVLCDTEEKAKDFLEECYKRKFCWVSNITKETFWEQYKNETCYSNDFNFDNRLGYGIKDFYQERDYKIIKWEMESPFIENKIDYDREYNIKEMIEMDKNIEYIYKGSNLRYKIIDGNLYYYGCDSWEKSDLCLKTIFKMKFKPIKEDKKVSFEEAIQAYGKEIYCVWKDDDEIEHKSEYCIRNEWDQCITDQNCEHLAPAEILKGEWYIKED